MPRPQRPVVERLMAECGEPYTVIVRGHVSAEEYGRHYTAELDRPAPPDETIRHSWGRWVPIPPARCDEDYPIVRWLHPADPHERGAFPYTETTRDLP